MCSGPCRRRSMCRSPCCSARARFSGAEGAPAMIKIRAALAILALMLAVTPATAQGPVEMKVGLAALVNTALPLHLAEAGGFYAKHGLKVTIVDAGGGTRGGRALATGDLQVMHV